ncbi:MAG TPA: DUF5004 domain-containing protein [Anseongella sp.]|nr:DUF5004 domain-containing protein [Anseongella sp.]
MKTNSGKLRTYLSVFLVAALLAACKTEEFYFQEPGKDIAGTWEVVKVMRNGADITSRVAGGFEITFQENGSDYDLGGNALPFIVSKKGTWSFDDPAYPFAISFRAEGSAGEVTVPFLFPVSGGKRQIQFSFSPGCGGNTYEYLLEENSTNE